MPGVGEGMRVPSMPAVHHLKSLLTRASVGGADGWPCHLPQTRIPGQEASSEKLY